MTKECGPEKHRQEAADAHRAKSSKQYPKKGYPKKGKARDSGGPASSNVRASNETRPADDARALDDGRSRSRLPRAVQAMPPAEIFQTGEPSQKTPMTPSQSANPEPEEDREGQSEEWE